MASNQRYEPVSTSEPPPPSSVPVVLTIAIPLEDDTVCSPPPPYEPTEDQDTARDTDLPPSYDIAAKLPTYEEVERVKGDQDGLVERNAILLDGGVEVALGNDWLFLICFILAFVFNWLGFFAAYCMTNTIAGRYGAMSGFGLSAVKWILILKNSSSVDTEFVHSWLWWIALALGWLIFVQSILTYLNIKWWVKKGCRSFQRHWGMPRGSRDN